MANKQLTDFIKEARKKGYGDLEIRNALIEHKWPMKEVENAFAYLNPKYENKNQINLFLSDELIDVLEKRAKKNMFTISEQIEDILRRSCVGQKKKKSPYDAKLDDTLVGIFSRRNTGRKGK
ncbi:hypothetical protein A3K82_02100 [Candidatus Pacearchaeota archaeon RBG_19FT_COMBO_34_9]|nr:MAG: hypothetical protein A3K82_02100 [Candidatus Pacearchaeota archaeon RBG_19FT_COMBO_34_9]